MRDGLTLAGAVWQRVLEAFGTKWRLDLHVP